MCKDGKPDPEHGPFGDEPIRCAPDDHHYGPWQAVSEPFARNWDKPMEERLCAVCHLLDFRATRWPPGPKSSDLTPRQRAIVRAYFAAGCRATRAARALGVGRHRVHEVLRYPGARVYLAELEAMAAQAITQARAAQILEPMLR